MNKQVSNEYVSLQIITRDYFYEWIKLQYLATSG